jgi:probable HAF family extracellular repeat protein
MTARQPVALCCLLGLILGSLGKVRAASFEGLDFAPWAVSADGATVVGTEGKWPGGGVREAIRWTPETGPVGLGFLHPGDKNSWARGVSGNGSVVVGWSAGDRTEAFRWTAETGMVGVGFLYPGQSRATQARGVSADGSVVVGYDFRLPARDEAFRWTPADGMVGLGTLPESASRSSSAYGVSGDGSVVVGGSGQAFRWTAQTGMVGIGELTYGGTAGTAASADGAVVVGDSGRQAFRWTAETGMVSLGSLPPPDPFGSYRYEANGVSADGSLVVGTVEEIGDTPTDPPVLAWIWDQTHGMRDLQEVLTNDFGLDLPGWDLVAATDISADGRVIVGWAWYEPAGEFPRRLGYRAVIPEPSPLLLLSCALLPLLGYAWRNQRRAYKA